MAGPYAYRLSRAPEKILYREGPEIPDVGRAIDSGSTAVKPECLTIGRKYFFFESG